MIVVVDFGSQSAHLITRRLREISVETMFIEPDEYFEKTNGVTVDGIILSGGPQSVYENGPQIDNKIFELGIPVFGICYGQQYLAHNIGGKVVPSHHRETGPATFRRTSETPLFKIGTDLQIADESIVWMSHSDTVEQLPEGFRSTGTTDVTPYAAIANEDRKMYGVQFHPELIHTQFGKQILWNFAEICGLKPKEHVIDREFVDSLIVDIRDSVGNAKVVSAMSGGVDSSISTLLVHEAIGDNLTAIYIDSGLMREGETDTLKEVFQEHFKMNVKIVHAQEEFLHNLRNVLDPEQKRKIIGKTFIDILEREAKELNADYLVQGTIWPDVIESAGTKHSQVIKTHHNVGGLPENMVLRLVEPIRNFYKDEVRKIGAVLGLPQKITQRKPFPGPGLAVRIVGEVTEQKLDILRRADRIVQDEIEAYEGKDSLWQIFAVFTGIKTTGVGGDNRFYGETIAIRAVDSHDAMSAHWSRIPYEILASMSTRITNEIKEVNRVVYDITDKPPGTIEWE
ncbi:MAG: glutamine-hydrolyzing GMP synthase [Patescibacteria group bacterium]